MPHFTTFQLPETAPGYAGPPVIRLGARAGDAGGPKKGVPLAAVDGTGLEPRHTSRYYVNRRSRSGDRDQITTYAKFPKVVFVVDCTSHMILVAIPGCGPGSDLVRFDAALEQPFAVLDRDSSGGRGLRRRVGPPQRPVAWVSHPHPADARATDTQATKGPLAAADEAAVQSCKQKYGLRGRWRRSTDGEAAIGFAVAEVPEPMPRDHAESHSNNVMIVRLRVFTEQDVALY